MMLSLKPLCLDKKKKKKTKPDQSHEFLKRYFP